jgi:hypothetical protein
MKLQWKFPTWPPILSEGHKPGMLENRALRIYPCMRQGVGGEGRTKLHKGKLQMRPFIA